MYIYIYTHIYIYLYIYIYIYVYTYFVAGTRSTAIDGPRQKKAVFISQLYRLMIWVCTLRASIEFETSTRYFELLRTATQDSILQHTALHCNTLHHTAATY